MIDKPVVKPISLMDDETFLKHLNARHLPLAGLSVVGKSNVPGDEDEHLLRAYHDRLHDLYDEGPPENPSSKERTNLDHIHGKAKQ